MRDIISTHHGDILPHPTTGPEDVCDITMAAVFTYSLFSLSSSLVTVMATTGLTLCSTRIHDAQMNCSQSSRKFLLSEHLNGIILPLLLCMYVLHTAVRLMGLILT